MATAAQIAACAANAQHSTGPRSPDGRAVSSRNALKFGLYSQADLLPGEDPADLEQLARDFDDEYCPEGPLETSLVRDLVRGIWLERRYTRIEAEIVNARFAALSAEDRQFPLGTIYIQDAEGPNLLQKIERRRTAARRQFQRVMLELRRLQDERRALQPQPAPNPTRQPAMATPVSKIPAPSVRFDKPVNAGPSPDRTLSDNGDNPALRL
jgi:hypothetical protein